MISGSVRKNEIHRVLQQKGFGLPQIQSAGYLIDNEKNNKYFEEGLEVCENCSLGCNSSKSLGVGPITSPLMIIGDYANEDDEQVGIPFTGPNGYFLTMALQVLGVDRRAIYLSNVIKCKLFGTPTPDEVATCKPYLEYEINRVKPKVIVTLGSTAIKALTNKFETKVGKVRGGVYTVGDTKIFTTWHPNYIMSQQGVDYIKARDEFIFDLKRAVDTAKNINPNYRWIL